MHDDHNMWLKREEFLNAELRLAMHTYEPRVIIESGEKCNISNEVETIF